MIEFEKYVVIPDLHGEHLKLRTVIEKYRNVPSLGFISLGDTVDGRVGSNPKETISILKDIGAVLVWGNHDLVMMGSVDELDTNVREDIYQDAWRRKYDLNNSTPQSYGVNVRGLTRAQIAEDLRQALKKHQHLEYLRSGYAYFQNEQFIAIHAGTENKPWTDQARELDTFVHEVRARNYSNMPLQIFDDDFSLSTQESSVQATELIVVSGHSHDRKNTNNPNPRRIRLACDFKRDLPLFIWESWTGEIKANVG